MLGIKHAGGKLGGLATTRHRAGRRAEARRGGRQGQAADRARQGRLRGRPDVLQHPDGDPQADHGGRRVPDQPERRPLAARRQGLQPVLLLHLLPERSAAGGARQVRAGQGLQEGLPAGAQLPGRQGHDRRLQEALQRRDRRRGLHAAGPARFLGRARQDRGRQARRLLRVHAGRHGRQPRQAVSPGRARDAFRSCRSSPSTSRRCRPSRTRPSASSPA